MFAPPAMQAAFDITVPVSASPQSFVTRLRESAASFAQPNEFMLENLLIIVRSSSLDLPKPMPGSKQRLDFDNPQLSAISRA